MAVIKAVSSRALIGTALDYVTKKEKTEAKLISGLNCRPETVKDEMAATKLLWQKTGGRTYLHYVQSFAPDENITPEQAHELACRFAKEQPNWKGFEVLIATHKDRKHIHTHFIINSVNFENGYKFQQSKKDLQNMKDISDRLCLEYGFSITEKGKTFNKEEREETTAYKRKTYEFLKKAENGSVKSYIQDIALAVMDCKENAVNKRDFIRLMEEKGYKTDWSDSRKYITFTDLSLQKQGVKQCKVRNNKLEKYYNINFSKEGLLNEFESNARRSQEARDAAEAAKQQLKQLDNRGIDGNNNQPDGELESGTREVGSVRTDNIQSEITGIRIAIAKSEASVRADDSKRADREAHEESIKRERERAQREKSFKRKRRSFEIG